MSTDNTDRRLAMTPMSNPNDLKKYLDSAKGVIAAALPGHLKPDRMLRLALTAFSTTPKLRECTPFSILASIVVASQIGLEPGIAGQGYLIPYKGTCTFVPGWQGLVGLLNNTGRATAWTGAVFKGDEFEFQLGSHPLIRHIPGDNHGDPKLMEWVYACGKVNGSEQPVIEAWRMARVWAHRDKFNKVGGAHYSFQHPEMYARKVVLLQVLKYMPRSIELNNGIVASDAAEMNRATGVQDGVVIDLGDADDSGGLPAGNVGRPSITEAAQQEKQAKAKPVEEKHAETPPIHDEKTSEPLIPAKDTAAPTAKELLDDILARGGKIDAGASRIEKAAAGLRYIEPADKLKNLSAEKLAELLDAWEEISDAIQHLEPKP